MLQNILKDYSNPDDALNKCWSASKRLRNILDKLNINNVCLVWCNGWMGDTAFMHDWYYKECMESEDSAIMDTSGIGHYMVRVGESFIDFTSRQFFRDAPYPTVYTSDDLNDMWDEWGEE